MWRTELAAAAAEYAEQVLAKALGRIPADVEVRTVALEGAAGPALVGFADREDDLLVVGDGQRRGIRRLWSGRVARHCLRRSACPVLVAPPPALSRVDGRALARELQRLVDAA
jgi:nucleotide-binding universal stress UspA family protein